MSSKTIYEHEVKRETYCRHGFHEWEELDEQDKQAEPSKSLLKCKHCGLYKKKLKG